MLGANETNDHVTGSLNTLPHENRRAKPSAVTRPISPPLSASSGPESRVHFAEEGLPFAAWVEVSGSGLGQTTYVDEPSVADWMSAWGQVIGGLGGLAGFVALGIELPRQRNRSRKPPVDLLLSLAWLEESFGDVSANGGRESFWFLAPERRREESRLAILNGQVVDDELNSLVATARAFYLDASALAPGHEQLRSPLAAGQVQRQLGAVDQGRAATTDAINRANELLRKHTHLPERDSLVIDAVSPLLRPRMAGPASRSGRAPHARNMPLARDRRLSIAVGSGLAE